MTVASAAPRPAPPKDSGRARPSQPSSAMASHRLLSRGRGGLSTPSLGRGCWARQSRQKLSRLSRRRALSSVSWVMSGGGPWLDRKSTRLNSSHVKISDADFCLKKKRLDDIHIIYLAT